MQNIIVLCRHCESPISFSFFRFRFGPHEYCHPTAPTLSSKAGRLLLGRPHLLLSRRRTSIAIQAAPTVSSKAGRLLPRPDRCGTTFHIQYTGGFSEWLLHVCNFYHSNLFHNSIYIFICPPILLLTAII